MQLKSSVTDQACSSGNCQCVRHTVLSLWLLRNKVLMCRPARRDAHPQAPSSPRWLSPRLHSDALPASPPHHWLHPPEAPSFSAFTLLWLFLRCCPEPQRLCPAVRYSIRTAKCTPSLLNLTGVWVSAEGEQTPLFQVPTDILLPSKQQLATTDTTCTPSPPPYCLASLLVPQPRAVGATALPHQASEGCRMLCPRDFARQKA